MMMAVAVNVNRVVAVDGCECEEWLLLMAVTVNVNRVVAVDDCGSECEQSGCC